MDIKIEGRVVRGDGYGKKLGFPTANLDRREYSRKKMKVDLGVYAGTATLPGGQICKAGIVIGPLDKRKLPKLEAYLIGFSGSLYGQKIILHLYKFLRPFRSFKDESGLKRQIAEDVRRVEKLVAVNDVSR